MFHNILVCVDGSAHADRALAEAIDIAEAQRSRLSLLTSQSAPAYWATTPLTASGMEPLSVQYAREAEKSLRKAVDRIPTSVPVTTVLSPEPIRDALMEQIRTGKFDLVVLGSRGRGALTASLMGSVSHYALNHSRVPILVVHADKDDCAQDRAGAEDRAPLAAAP
jgi:nucleotide-binding universal stress UspA family protein